MQRGSTGEKWLTSASSDGWALVLGDRVIATNPAFLNLDAPHTGGTRWRPREAEGEGTALSEEFPSLHAVVLAEATHLRVEQRWPDRRLFVNEVGTVVEVKSEKFRIRRRPSTVLLLVRDVTAVVEQEAALQSAHMLLARQESIRAAGELAVGIGHDANNLLTALALRIDGLLRDEGRVQFVRSEVEGFKMLVEDARRLVRRLQNMGRDDEPRPEPMDIREVVASAIEIADPALRIRGLEEARRIRISTELPELPMVAGLPNETRDLFINLLINARDAMPAGGNIVIRGRCWRGMVEVAVDDEGTGIPPDHLPRIFDAFFTTKGENGTGMGLATAERTMKRLDGSIAARNRPTGGASFILRFRIVQRRLAREDPPAGRRRPAA